MDEQNNKLLIAILVVATLTLVSSLAIVKEETDGGQVETKIMGKTLWKSK